MKVKCPGCGTAFKYDRHKCPRCGAVYFDMSCIDFFGNERVYLEINAGQCNKPPHLLLSVKPRLRECDFVFDHITTYDRYGNPKRSIPTACSITARISFEGVTPLDEATRNDVDEND